jgi:hypothetical protein
MILTYPEFGALPATLRSEIGPCDDCSYERAGITLCDAHRQRSTS